jgi:hypothetical protein
LPGVEQKQGQDWRTQLSFRINRDLLFRNRVELLWYDKGGAAAEEGFLTNADLVFQHLIKGVSGSLRFQYFETGGYNSRIYAYENDILYSFSVPVFYDKGVRYYININYELNNKLTVWGRISRTVYPGKTLIGSGLDEIRGNARTEAGIQVLYSF